MKPASSRKRRSLRRTQSLTGKPPPASHLFSSVPVFIAYGDIASARHAMAQLNQLLRVSHPHCALRPMLWPFGQLANAKWCAMAVRDAGRASAITLAVANDAALNDAPEAWLKALLQQIRGASFKVLVLVGENETWTMTLAQSAAKSAATVKAGTVLLPQSTPVAKSPKQAAIVAA